MMAPVQTPAPQPAPVRGVRFAGYAAIYRTLDRGGDSIAPGAFAATLARWRALGRWPPLLWQHDPARPIGTIVALDSDGAGLRLVADVTDANAARLVRARRLTGLSFGYRVVAASGTMPRHLNALDLAEVSLVTRPMQPAARIVAVQSAAPDNDQ